MTCLNVNGSGLYVSTTNTRTTGVDNWKATFCNFRAKNWYGGSVYGLPYYERWGGAVSGNCGVGSVAQDIGWYTTFPANSPLFGSMFIDGTDMTGYPGVNLWR
ncbi:hypothetical protein SAMN04489743_1104 [Pseudarthrobacter equi]|uniref:Uncharacterized protein n=1 Tax=Pseudarthrobacter equi TaxID=728066 RepID=A0A1H1VT04_9MICC|nr:hypothetical protein SAMN04489743_1104 [Pseudarthrobacter equi]